MLIFLLKKKCKIPCSHPNSILCSSSYKKQKYLSNKKISTFVDFDSGTGLVVSYVRDYLGYKNIYGYELIKSLIKKLKKNYEKVKIFNKKCENFSKNDQIFFDKVDKKKQFSYIFLIHSILY